MKLTTALDIDNKKIVYDGCMVTFTGTIINLYSPNSNEYCLEDIAHHLAFICRWNGATKTFYSVAEHCCMMHDKAPAHLKAIALFHDCEEAYWGDIIKPVKNLLPVEMRHLMKRMRYIIMNKFGVTSEIMPREIEDLDFEFLQWDLENLILTNNHKGMDCYTAEQEWLKRATSLTSRPLPGE